MRERGKERRKERGREMVWKRERESEQECVFVEKGECLIERMLEV